MNNFDHLLFEWDETFHLGYFVDQWILIYKYYLTDREINRIISFLVKQVQFQAFNKHRIIFIIFLIVYGDGNN